MLALVTSCSLCSGRLWMQKLDWPVLYSYCSRTWHCVQLQTCMKIRLSIQIIVHAKIMHRNLPQTVCTFMKIRLFIKLLSMLRIRYRNVSQIVCTFCIHVLKLKFTHTCMHACTHVQAGTHACMHTHTHTHTHTPSVAELILHYAW